MALVKKCQDNVRGRGTPSSDISHPHSRTWSRRRGRGEAARTPTPLRRETQALRGSGEQNGKEKQTRNPGGNFRPGLMWTRTLFDRGVLQSGKRS